MEKNVGGRKLAVEREIAKSKVEMKQDDRITKWHCETSAESVGKAFPSS